MKKTLALLLVALLVLTGCGSKGGDDVEYVNEYSYVYTTDIDTLDYVYSMRATNADHTSNFVDGLLELDNLGNFISSIAESYTVSEDGLTYTFKIREGVKWVTNTGEEYADVTAHDFVYGLKHAVDVESEMIFIVEDTIKGLAEYYADPAVGFDSVGVKAEDDYTLVYELVNPESFFYTKLNYGIMMPVNEEFVNSIGLENYGTVDPASILYNGPYLLSNNTSNSVIEYVKNDAYWDKDNVFVEKVKFTFFDGSDPDTLYQQFAEGNFTQARVYPTSAGYETVKAQDGDNIIFSQLNGVVFNFNWNLNRRMFDVSQKDETQQSDTKTAILNDDFRYAVLHAFDREAYLSHSVGEDAAATILRNDFVPPSFVTTEGIDYPQAVLDELNTLNADKWKGLDLTDGQDAFFNPEKAKEHAAAAKAALEAQGVSFPVVVELPVSQTSELQVAQAKSFENSIEEHIGDLVDISIILLDQQPYLDATYYSDYGRTADYDISNASGWGPDYIDPSTYLNIYATASGDMIHTIGLDRTSQEDDQSAEVRAVLGYEEYDALIKAANAIFDSEVDRMAAFAKADAWMVNKAIQIPTHGQGGTPSVTKVVPFTRAYGWTGNGSERFKYVRIQKDPISAAEYEELKAAWEKARS